MKKTWKYSKMKCSYIGFFLYCLIFHGHYFSVLAQQPNLIDSLEQVLAQTDDDLKRGRLLYHLGINSYRLDTDKALQYGQECLKIALKLENYTLMASAYQVLFISNFNLGNYDKAVEQALNELEAANKSGQIAYKATAYHDLALVYDDLGEYEKSLYNNFQALKIREILLDSLNNKPGGYRSLGFSYNNIGAVFFSMNKYDSSLYYFRKGLKARRLAGHVYGISESLTNMGYIHEHLNNLDSAIYYGLQSLELEMQLKDQHGIANTYINLASAYFKLGQIQKAKSLLDSSIIICKIINIPKRLLEAYDHYKRLYLDQKDYEKALQYYEQYVMLKDSIFSAEKTNQIAYLNVKYETEKKESEIQLLKTESELQEAALHRQQILRNVIIGGAAITILIILLLFHRYRYMQRVKMAEAARIQELDRIKSNFFANISHEFRTPLTLIKGSLFKLLNAQESLDPINIIGECRLMERNTNRLLQLINQLLELSRLDDGKTQLKAAKGEIVSYLKRIVMSFASYAEQKEITLLFNKQPIDSIGVNMGLELYFDPDKTDKIFYNLLSNAVKFTPQGGEIQVDIMLQGVSNQLQIIVSNTGEGIPADKLPYVFDRFYQADDNSTRRYEGTGIGLALVKELVELHHGTIAAESREHELTTFTVTLPLGKNHLSADEIEEDLRLTEKEELDKIVVDLPIQKIKGENQESRENLEQTLILIVEDHPELRQYIRINLPAEYQVMEASNGKDGLEKAIEHIPDLIISDIMMPEMDGYEFCRKLKKNIKTDHIPVIILTAKASQDNKLEGLSIGADDYLVKPFDPDELQARVKNLVVSRQRLREKYGQQVELKPAGVMVDSTQKKFLDKLMQVLEQHISNENFGVEELGHEIGMSRAQVHRKIKAITNHSPSEFIRKFRLQRATDLIRKDAGNMAEIAYQVGFNSQAYFTRSFQEVYGCSPSEYKKKNIELS